MIAVIVGAAVVLVLVCMVAAILIGRPEGQHAGPRKPWLRPFLADAFAALAKVNGLRGGELSDEDKATELWVDGLTVRKQHGPPAPARRPQALTAARVRTAALIRAIPLDAVPWLQKGHDYNDGTGSFEALTAPVLHAHESVSLTQADLAAGLAAQHAKEWGLPDA